MAQYLARSSNSPLRTARRKAATSAREPTTTGPLGKRELRSAISPSASSASSTQFPLGLLAELFRHWMLLKEAKCTCRCSCTGTCGCKLDTPRWGRDERHHRGGRGGWGAVGSPP